MSRKTHPVTSNIQTLLHQDNDIHDPSLIEAHLCKKIDVALNALPTVPALRGVSFEVIASAFIFLYRNEHLKSSECNLKAALCRACDTVSSLLSYSVSGWSDKVLKWSINILAKLTSLAGNRTRPEDNVSYWVNQPFVKELVEFVKDGVKYKLDQGEASSVMPDIIRIINRERANMGWLLAQIISLSPSLLIHSLMLSSGSLHTDICIATMSHTTHLVGRDHPNIVKEALVHLVECVMKGDGGDEGKGDRVSMHDLFTFIQIIAQSNQLLDLVGNDVLKLASAKQILSLIHREVEHTMAEEGELREEEMDEGELKSDEEGEEMEVGSAKKGSDVSLSLVDSLSSLLLQLKGCDAVCGIEVLVDCATLCKRHEGEEEDGEINTLAIAKRQLGEAVDRIMGKLLDTLHMAVASILSYSPSTKLSSTPLQYVVSLQCNLMEWTKQLACDKHDTRLGGWLRQLVECIGLCSPEVTVAQIMNQLLSLCSEERQLPMMVSLYQHYLVCHPGLTSTMLMQGVTKLTNDADYSAIERWCCNLHSISQSELRDHFQSILPQSYMALITLLPLTLPKAAIHLIDLLEPVTSEFLEKSPHSNVVMVVGKLLNQFYQLLFSVAQDIMRGRESSNHLILKEQHLVKCRELISRISCDDPGIKSYICSSIISHITSKEVSGYFTLSPNASPAPTTLLHNLNYISIQGSLLNTRQIQHSSSAHDHAQSTTAKGKIITLSQLAVTHCNDHVMWLLDDVISKSTNQLASVVMDTIAPHSFSPLKAWPEYDAGVSSRHTLELHLSIKRWLDEHPILWKILLLISSDSEGLMKCSSAVYSIYLILTSHWQRHRSLKCSVFPKELRSSQILVECLAKAHWLTPPLCYVGEIFEHLTCNEVAQIHMLCGQHIKAIYSTSLLTNGTQVEVDERIVQTLKAILRRNIHKIGHLYARFVRSNTCTNVESF